MPNHVDNKLTITGDREELKRFVSATHKGGNDYDFNELVPLDPRASKVVRWEREDGTENVFSAFSTEEDGFDGYQNALDVWGTKWGAYDIQPNGAWQEVLDKDDYHDISFSFMSAWSPASGLILRLSAQFPTLAFGSWFTEEGNAFAGWTLHKNGKEIAGNSYDGAFPECNWDNDDAVDKYEEEMNEVHEVLESQLHEATMEVMMGQQPHHIPVWRQMDNEDDTPEFEIDPRDIVIRRLQSTIHMMGAPHSTNGAEKEPYCIYCGTPFPCFTVRLARRSATAWKDLM